MDTFEDVHDVYRFIPSLQKRFSIPDEDDFFAGCTEKNDPKIREKTSTINSLKSNSCLPDALCSSVQVSQNFILPDNAVSLDACQTLKPRFDKNIAPVLTAINSAPVMKTKKVLPATSSDMETARSCMVLHRPNDLSPSGENDLKLHSSTNDTLHVSRLPSAEIGPTKYENNFQCSFKYAQHSKKVFNAGWPSIAKNDDSDLIDLFFSHSEHQEDLTLQNFSPTKDNLFGNHNTNFYTELGAVDDTEPMNRPPESQSIRDESAQEINNRTRSELTNGKMLIEALLSKHGDQLLPAHIPELLGSLRQGPGSLCELSDNNYRKSLSENDLSPAILLAQANQSWGEAFMIAHVGGVHATQKVIEKYIAEMQGKIHPSLHEILSFDYISIDTIGLLNNWIHYLEIAIRKINSSDARNYMEKLTNALSINDMHDEAAICNLLKTSCMKISRSSEESEIATESENLNNGVPDCETDIDEASDSCCVEKEIPKSVDSTGIGKTEPPLDHGINYGNHWTLMQKTDTCEQESYTEAGLAEISVSYENVKTPSQANKSLEEKWWPFQSKISGKSKSIILPDDAQKPYFNPHTKKWEVLTEDDHEFTAAVHEGPPRIIANANEEIQGNICKEFDQDFYTSAHGLNLRYADTFNV